MLLTVDPGKPLSEQLTSIGAVSYGIRNDQKVEIWSSSRYSSAVGNWSGPHANRFCEKWQELQGQQVVRILHPDFLISGFWLPERRTVVRYTRPWERRAGNWITESEVSFLNRLAREQPLMPRRLGAADQTHTGIASY